MKRQKQQVGVAGRKDNNVRSDCHVQIAITRRNGIRIDLRSKVEALYGMSIRILITEVLSGLGIPNADIVIDDSGAVPFVIVARVETAARRAVPELKASYLLPPSTHNKADKRDRLRRTRLYLPGNEPHFFLNAGLHKPDSLILDLEDGVPHSEKDAARILVRNALRQLDFGDSERMVRINQLPVGLEDLKAIVPHGVETILVPKCESAANVVRIEREITSIVEQHNIRQKIHLLPIIESALGVVHAFEIATASEWICGLAIGLEDYTADLGVERTKTGIESMYARSVIVNTAKAAGIQALDSVFSDVGDDVGLRQSVLEARAIGFEGKGCIHPRQIGIVHEAFAPTDTEVEHAQRVIEASEEAKRIGSGVISLGSKMIDAPVVKRAQRVLLLAKRK
ncbi:MAG: citE [Bacteroidetes bacterium]|nr:citE [Bacteroidota bacterium]